ncbi:MAG: RT0821/Lpp0805 family surface protein [Gammaproteobacteria bacterium]
MNRLTTMISAGTLVVILASGCATQEQAGGLVGGAIGAAVGSTVGEGGGRIAAIILGTMAGAMIGTHVGQHMDEHDRIRTAQVLEQNRTGQQSTWRNPDTGSTYTITPTRTYDVEQSPCREFTMKANVGGKQEDVFGTACRQPDGAWKIIK